VREATHYAPPLSSRWAPKRLACRRADATYQYFPKPNTFPRWPLQPPYALRPRWVKRPGGLDLWPFDLESGVRVTCDVGYLCVNFNLHRPLCSWVRPTVRDRQSDVRRQKKASPISDGGIISKWSCHCLSRPPKNHREIRSIGLVSQLHQLLACKVNTCSMLSLYWKWVLMVTWNASHSPVRQSAYT